MVVLLPEPPQCWDCGLWHLHAGWLLSDVELSLVCVHGVNNFMQRDEILCLLFVIFLLLLLI